MARMEKTLAYQSRAAAERWGTQSPASFTHSGLRAAFLPLQALNGNSS